MSFFKIKESLVLSVVGSIFIFFWSYGYWVVFVLCIPFTGLTCILDAGKASNLELPHSLIFLAPVTIFYITTTINIQTVINLKNFVTLQCCSFELLRIILLPYKPSTLIYAPINRFKLICVIIKNLL